ncbi:hypothetical protein [Bacteroides sp.]|uniref:hypothetical protein n=1 Tax=Bacteroides sp. TaxID=29523 RepID=UPI0026111E0F|nr:hypothetical protein [Bacteroides sp.]MDD3040305.1 hypothetical protein [Bacteroides sp.]
MADEMQSVIDALIDHIDKAIKKGSVTNQQVAGVLNFLNEKLKSADSRYIRNDIPNSAKAVITFLEEIISEGLIEANGGVQFGNQFISGLLGTGGFIDKFGYGELRGLKVWGTIEAPEFRYNRVTINLGHQWQTNGGGIIKEVTMLDDQSGIITLDLDPGKYGAVDYDDLCIGIWHNETPSLNDTVTTDDGKGNYTFAGYGTSYFRITEILDTVHNSQFSFTLRPISEKHKRQTIPQVGMHFAQFGNPTNKDRQSSVYSTTTYVRALVGVTTWEHSFANISAQLYDCSNLSVFGRDDLKDRSMYLRDIYMTGTIEQFENKPLTMDIDFSLGAFMAPGETGIITVKVLDGYGQDVTNTMTTWEWTRESGDAMSDLAWSITHKNDKNVLAITYSDLGPNSDTNISTMFTVKASDGIKNVQGELTI